MAHHLSTLFWAHHLVRHTGKNSSVTSQLLGRWLKLGATVIFTHKTGYHRIDGTFLSMTAFCKIDWLARGSSDFTTGHSLGSMANSRTKHVVSAHGWSHGQCCTGDELQCCSAETSGLVTMLIYEDNLVAGGVEFRVDQGVLPPPQTTQICWQQRSADMEQIPKGNR